MAFMLNLQKYKKNSAPFLVVCPTTVLSHWSCKILDHAPGLKAVVYHGGERDLEATIKNHNVLLTSYGVLRRYIYKLKKLSFPLVVFDEVQYIKNPETT